MTMLLRQLESARIFAEQNGPDENPIASWAPATGGTAILVGDDRLFVLPATRAGIIAPPERLRNVDWGRVIMANDLGPFLGLPPVGAAGSRVFKAGPNLGVMVDAGTNQTAATYLHHVAARVRDLGISRVQAVVLIHGHGDHFNMIDSVVREFNISPQNVFIPRQYMQQLSQRSFEQVIRALQARFGTTWQPTYINLRPANASGSIVRGRLQVSNATFEFVALSSALRNVVRHTDRASLLTRASRRGEPGAIVVLGDLRGADLDQFHRQMGQQAWRQYFDGVTTLSGFSHHRGALSTGDKSGILNLLNATLLRNGVLTVLVQTDPARSGNLGQGRADTLDFMRNIGIVVRETHASGDSRQISGVRGGTRGGVASGPHAAAHQPIPSRLTQALARIQTLADARATLSTWAPYFRSANPDFNLTRELREIDTSLTTLRAAVRDALDKAVDVRVSGARTQGGNRNYRSGTHGDAFQRALRDIPSSTQAETRIGANGFATLRRYRRMNPNEVPLQIALNDALVNGRYSRRAFQYMLSQLDPRTRESLIRGRRGGMTTHEAAWRRVRAEYGFRQAALAGTGMISTARWSGARRGAARGFVGFLAALELFNIGSQAYQTFRVSQGQARDRNIVRFLRRIMFWRQMRAEPSVLAIEDNLVADNVYERRPEQIDQGLESGRWDFLMIEHSDTQPALSDVNILRFITILGFNVRNYDEFATLMIDSGQDAIEWRSGSGSWTDASWYVRYGRFSTSGVNSIQEDWVELPLLTEGMRKYTEMVIANTRTLLQRIAQGDEPSTEAAGALVKPRGRIQYTAELRSGIRESQVKIYPEVPAQWGGWSQPVPAIEHRVIWHTSQRPRFFVWEERQTEARVSGADYNSYVRLRQLESRKYLVVANRRSLNELSSQLVGNEAGDAWIPKSELSRV